MSNFDLSKIKGFFFDLDGTLIDSQLNFESMRKDLQVPADVDILGYVNSIECTKKKSKALDIIHEHELIGAKKSTVIPGVRELLDYLQKQGMLIGILTRNSKECSQIMLNMHNLNVPILITRDDALPKPSPDGLNKLRSHFNLTKEQCIYVGDYIHDLHSAKNAQMAPVLYMNDKNSHYEQDAIFTIKCYTKFLNELKKSRSDNL